MKTTNKTVLVTGGGSGIGFQVVKQFSEKGNNVLIVGRDEERLKQAAAQLQNVAYFVADVSKESDIDNLVSHLTKNYPSLDLVINNAAATNVYQLTTEAGSFEKAKNEIATNYLSVVNLTETLLPLLKKQPEAAIVNVNAILGLTPSIHMPTHSASKAALRAYTQVLRYTLDAAGSTVKIFEVYPPLVKTDFSKAIGSEANGMPPEEVATALLHGLEDNTPEIYIGQTEGFYKAFFAATEPALAALNQPKR